MCAWARGGGGSRQGREAEWLLYVPLPERTQRMGRSPFGVAAGKQRQWMSPGGGSVRGSASHPAPVWGDFARRLHMVFCIGCCVGKYQGIYV